MVLDEDSQKMLAQLKRKRGVVKSSLTRIVTFVNKFNPSEDAFSLLNFRQEELPQINRKFDDIQSEIELLTGEETEDAEEEREKFETDYYEIRSRIQELINNEKLASTTGPNASFGNTSYTNRMHLAPIPLPKFSGNIQDWSSFYDIYRVMIHDDSSFSPAQKFYYLRSCLSDQALDLVRSIPVSDGNYDVIIQMLKQRYDNKGLVVQSHIRAILDSPKVIEASSKELQGLCSHVGTHVAALKALGQPVQYWDAWLVTIVLSRLDHLSVHEWELRKGSTEMPSFEELDKFLSSRCTAFESSEAWSSSKYGDGQEFQALKKIKHSTSSKKVTLAAMDDSKNNCKCCGESHRLYNCQKFKDLMVNDRLSIVREARLCFNCFSPFHMVNLCKSKWSCQQCRKKHNSLLHYEIIKATEDKTKEQMCEGNSCESDKEESSATVLPVSLAVNRMRSHVFLATAIMWVIDSHGQKVKCKAVLDNGSQVNFISKRLVNMLQITVNKTDLPVRGIGASSVRSAAITNVHIKSRVRPFETNLSCYVLPMIVNDLPSCIAPTEGWQIPNEYVDELADPLFFKSSPIDLLIGGGSFYDLLENERVRLNNATLSLQNTKFGWLVTGEIGAQCLLSTNSIGAELEEGWIALQSNEEEVYGRMSKNNKRSMEAQDALEHFRKTAKRNAEGRFVLKLPVKPDVTNLGDTLNMARSRFLTIERRLQRDEVLNEEYVKFMDEYLKMGHMQEVIEEEVPRRSCYLPHHAIMKTSSLTTKVRVVFDASAKGSNGLALNDILLCGPAIQDDVFTILTRFRKHLYAITADVEKMYRQVAIDEEDCDLQRIIWRSSPSEKMRTYRLMTVTYGTASASFMATQCLAALAEEFEEKCPKAAKAIRCDFYMDDLMTGSDNEEDCLSLHHEITSIMDSGKFPLRKWCSNSDYLRERIGKGHKDPLFALEIGDEDIVKSLGLCWKPVADEFRFNVSTNLKRNKVTKRSILSDLNRIFDPLGFLTPVLIKGKIFLQQLWQIKADWDSTLPRNIQERWYKFYDDLEELKSLAIPRSVKSSHVVEIHGFCDASQEAYGACVFVRSQDLEGIWKVQLLCARSRVAPMKSTTIPRLELNGALVLAQLVYKTSEAWEIDVHMCHLWTDSTVVLGWLNSQTNLLKVYVGNRINQILELTNAEQWKYVRTSENPADLISRGIKARELRANELWWKGPSWLSTPDYLCTYNPCVIKNENELPEKRISKLALINVEKSYDLVHYYSDWSRLKKAMAWLGRFVDYLKGKGKIQCERYLTVQELRKAEGQLLKRAQADFFHDEIQALKDGKELPSRSKLKCLYPFIRNGLILVGGRLTNADVQETQKHPIVLPPSHIITRLIVKDIHLNQLHSGPTALLAAVRLRFWPLRGRSLTRSVVLRCIRCTRAKPRFNEPLMASLPKNRVQVTRPFAITGIDFAGPLIIRSGARGIRGKKAWIAVFVCFSTRAVHLETVEDLSSSAFMAALLRFISRRGYCSTIYSDNGTNFIGAQRELVSYITNAVPNMAQVGIDWHFNPPAAPHFGGLWESAVKSAKHHLTRVLTEAKLSLGELNTLLCQVEACLNSRPITAMSSDPNEPDALTPAHFLIGGPITLPPEPDMTNAAPSIIRRWKHVQFLMQTFWKRWKTEYLPQYQVRGKWTTRKPPLKIDDVVIIKEECISPTKWKLGRIVQVHPGSDGIIRVATVRLGSGSEMKRPTVKLCVLPTESDQDVVEN